MLQRARSILRPAPEDTLIDGVMVHWYNVHNDMEMNFKVTGRWMIFYSGSKRFLHPCFPGR